MIFDDETPKPPPARLSKLNLEPLGVAELQGYIAELHAEITRAEAEITKKGLSRNAAEAFFRKPSEG